MELTRVNKCDGSDGKAGDSELERSWVQSLAKAKLEKWYFLFSIGCFGAFEIYPQTCMR